jgi:hypothetical protein
MDNISNERLHILVARDDIYQLVCTYMRGQDRLDAKTHRSVFWDDAYLDYGFYLGGPDGFVDFAQTALTRYSSCHHLIGQVQIEVEGDQAYGEVYYQAFHKGVDEDGQSIDRIIAGRYIDRYERRDGVWKIAYRAELADWARQDTSLDAFFADNKMPRGDRFPKDRLYQRDMFKKPE